MNRKEHQQLDEVSLGYTIPEVHELIDNAVKWLGAGHRIAYHTSATLDFAESIWGKRGRNVALLHILADAKIIDGKKVLMRIY